MSAAATDPKHRKTARLVSRSAQRPLACCGSIALPPLALRAGYAPRPGASRARAVSLARRIEDAAIAALYAFVDIAAGRRRPAQGLVDRFRDLEIKIRSALAEPQFEDARLLVI